MTSERYVRIIAGFFIIFSLTMAKIHSPFWLFFTAFVGLNLFQSGLTNWCLMSIILEKIGVPSCKKENGN
jgi:hypothetical protein